MCCVVCVLCFDVRDPQTMCFAQVMLIIFFTRLFTSAWLCTVEEEMTAMRPKEVWWLHNWGWVVVDAAVVATAALRVSLFAQVAETHRLMYFPSADPAPKVAWWVVLGLSALTLIVRARQLQKRE